MERYNASKIISYKEYVYLSDQRYDFPLVLAEELAVDAEPLVLVLVLGRGFFIVLVSDAALGTPWSFITIFAWISSNFDALTFFGQNNVTKLPDAPYHKWPYHRVPEVEDSPP